MNHMQSGRTLGLVIAVGLVVLGAWADTVDFTGVPVVGPTEVATQDKFHFAILGDKTSGGEGKWPIFDRAVDEINLQAPNFVITVGDQIPGHMQERAAWDAEWAEYLEHARRLEMPLVLIPGNHDIANLACHRFWKEDFGPTYFAFDYADVHFLVLNTEEERLDGRGPTWQKMMRFAETDLAAHRGSRHTFVFFHKPMWDDPRYAQDWARLSRALGDRPHTVVAGHEHYLMTERRGDGLYVLQSATGGGLHESEVRAIGEFHSFGYVTVDGGEVSYAVVEPGGGVWPVDIAPASFRKAIAHQIVTLDAETPEDVTAPVVHVRPVLRLHNVLDEPIAVEIQFTGLEESGWTPAHDTSADGVTVSLAPGARAARPLDFTVEQARLPYPPGVAWRVQYQGAWLENERYPMVQETALPLYPAQAWRVVPNWKVVGPFGLGDIDTGPLPDSPEKANANFYRRFGPEEGFDPERVYADGRRWFDVENQGRGLLNFNGILGTLDHVLGYALCAIRAPEAQRVHAVVYSDNYAQAVLNGELVESAQDFGTPCGFLYVPLDLRAGWNTLVMKLINNHGDWFLRALIADPNENLDFAAAPPENGS